MPIQNPNSYQPTIYYLVPSTYQYIIIYNRHYSTPVRVKVLSSRTFVRHRDVITRRTNFYLLNRCKRLKYFEHKPLSLFIIIFASHHCGARVYKNLVPI
jgi:hypothetical protein